MGFRTYAELRLVEQTGGSSSAYTHTHSTAKNYSVIDYRYATAFEAVLGYLYLNDRKERIDEILEVVLAGFQNGKIGSF